MHKIMAWFASKFAGKKTYAAIGVLLVKEVAEMLGVQIADEQISDAIDVVLLLIAGLARAAVKHEVVDANKLPQ
jgi:uncharacterized membrane protein